MTSNNASNGAQVVLVIDDDPDTREAMTAALQDRKVALASDGVEALEWLRDNPPPCAILLDLMMPRMDGWQFLEHVRRNERLAHVHVVIITAFKFKRELGEVANLPILRKPLELNELEQAVEGACHAGG
jgi:CheY-like chemotaxis protein